MKHHIPLFLTFDENEVESVAEYIGVLVNQTFTQVALFGFEDEHYE